MPAASLLALLDDIAAILDDVATLTKVAAKKTSGVLGDDLALNAEQVAGVRADRELPVVWAVARGSAVNKLILVPAALAISALAHWLITPLLMVGGAYLCFEGVEKLAHKPPRRAEGTATAHASQPVGVERAAADAAAKEKTKIRGAVRTDFVLSAEIVVITLGAVADAPFATQVMVVTAIAALMTVGVYGLVAGIVKLDDGGLYLAGRKGDGGWPRFQRAVGWGLLKGAPYLMKGLSIAGTVAMFLVGGGILTHGIPRMEGWKDSIEGAVAGIPVLGWGIAPLLYDAAAGMVAGAVALAVVSGGKSVVRRLRAKEPAAGG